MTVEDPESGIGSISYEIYDITLKTVVYSAAVNATTYAVEQTNRTKRVRDKSQY